ncbi:MAG TPA: PP2C family protein-serine/threonine phosphatase [Leptospiraceae bacterium]|nr:PP2C family protein-serine/threonine phosphatase [Leptospiraceae bacterium]
MAEFRMFSRMRSLFNPASSVYFYGLAVNSSTILLIRFVDPVYGPRIEWIPFIAFVSYYIFIALWLSRRLVRGARSLESWFDLVLITSFPVAIYYGYLSFVLPPYSIVFWIWGTTVGMPGFGYIRRRYWIVWVLIMFAATIPGFVLGAFEIRIILSMAWVVIMTFYMTRASNQLKKSRVALSVHLTEVRRNKRDLEKAHQKLKTAADRFQVELELAERLQQGLLPTLGTLSSGLTLRGRYLAMQNLGGDFYDVATAGDKTVLLVADVTGHGVAASLITTMTKASFHAHKHLLDPSEILAAINSDLCEFLTGGQHFVTAVCVQFDVSARRVIHANAGHPPGFHLSDGRLTTLGDDSLLLGLDRSLKWKSYTIEAKKSDRFFFYTDGLTETFSEDRSMYGERLESMLIKHSSLDSEAFLAALFDDLLEFRGSSPQSDDIAVVCVDMP